MYIFLSLSRSCSVAFFDHFGCSIENAYRITRKFREHKKKRTVIWEETDADAKCIRMQICVFHSLHSNYCNNPLISRVMVSYGVFAASTNSIWLDQFYWQHGKQSQQLLRGTAFTFKPKWNLMQTQIPRLLHYSYTQRVKIKWHVTLSIFFSFADLH